MITEIFAEDLATLQTLFAKIEKLNDEWYLKWCAAGAKAKPLLDAKGNLVRCGKNGTELEEMSEEYQYAYKRFRAVNLYLTGLEYAKKYCKEAAEIFND